MKDPETVFRAPIFPQEPWLSGAEQEQLVAGLLHYELIKMSNKRDLPLKSGGTTDIYINLRDARNHPEAIRFLANAFRNPLTRLNLDRFVEVPDAVSCLAGPISERTGLPYATIREEAKAGRVVKGKVIGKLIPGEQVAIIDDVITDGASKIAPYHECRRHGVHPTLVVAVDRQQGWREKFADEEIELAVWPGITLHKVRYHLINTFGIMERCDSVLEGNNPIVIALDGKEWDEFLPIIDQLRVTGCTFKVNDLLHDQNMRNIVEELSVYGRVMVDFKGHDIPNTVANTCKRYRNNPPWAVTVHGSGGEAMIKAAVEAFVGTPTKVLVITVLTSLDEVDCEEIYRRGPLTEVLKLAEIGHRAGAHGFVCSPKEVAELKKLYPGATFVIPGVRSHGAGAGDQSRIDTPESAIDSGADHIVMGRQIFNASNPVEEVRRVLKDELHIR